MASVNYLMEELLDGVVAFINEIRTHPRSPAVKEKVGRLAEIYCQLKEEEPAYLQQLDGLFANDVQLYVLVLSVLFFLFKDKALLDRMGQLAFSDGLSYEQALGVWKQVETIRFHQGWKEAPYKNSRELQEHLVNRLKQEIGFSNSDYKRIEGEENRILVVTDTLLSDLHAPTQLVLEMCRVLQEELGYEVLLLVCVEYIPQSRMEEIWLYPYRSHFDAGYYKDFTREYRGVTVKGYQQIVSRERFRELPGLFHKIEEWKPSMGWYIGGTSVAAELFQEVLPMAAMPCTDGYAVSAAPVLVSYMQNSAERQEEMSAYILQRGQKRQEIKLQVAGFLDTGDNLTAKDFGLPEDSFVIAVVGNRLDTEIDREFLSVMERILHQSDKAAFIIVGKCSREWEEPSFAGRVVKLGFREDLYNVLAGSKLFLNPKRMGAGGGAGCALKAGVPIVTLGDCDVAVVGQEFVCDSMEEYPEIVHRYETDKGFYQEMSALCRKKFYHDGKADHGEACASVVSAVREWTKEFA